MSGYYRAAAPGELQPPENGWYDTGDIVNMDDAGFITIAGRAKRFAKIGGEMISLPAVETLAAAAAAAPDFSHAAISVADARKGEVIILFTTDAALNVDVMLAAARAHGNTELMVPRDIRHVSEIPALATGKTDYVKLQAAAA